MSRLLRICTLNIRYIYVWVTLYVLNVRTSHTIKALYSYLLRGECGKKVKVKDIIIIWSGCWWLQNNNKVFYFLFFCCFPFSFILVLKMCRYFTYVSRTCVCVCAMRTCGWYGEYYGGCRREFSTIFIDINVWIKCS